MVLLIIIPFLNGYFIGNIPNIFRQTHVAMAMTQEPIQKRLIAGTYHTVDGKKSCWELLGTYETLEIMGL